MIGYTKKFFMAVKLLKNRDANDLRRIPGVGEIIARDLRELGIESVSDLKDADPERLYDQLCVLKGVRVDRCMLYVFRCAVYFASRKSHDPELLKWWRWKDKQGTGSRL
ncbi:hypothetical protein MNBD_NITROSPINAE03-1330 [hydrothermal vent metagenome]|uniref:Pathogenicity locus n=1 Tax=hydrothermal vent metagenome TaxID=652676 RepID=A0A3B1C8L3_9ZZZZ